MAIYFPKMFCGVGTKVKVKSAIELEFLDGTIRTYNPNTICVVDDIIGYGYNLKELKDQKVFRIMNSAMDTYFDVIEFIPFAEKLPKKYKNFEEIILKKDFIIEGVIHLMIGERFKHEISKADKIFHNLYCISNKRLILRMNNTEFSDFFS